MRLIYRDSTNLPILKFGYASDPESPAAPSPEPSIRVSMPATPLPAAPTAIAPTNRVDTPAPKATSPVHPPETHPTVMAMPTGTPALRPRRTQATPDGLGSESMPWRGSTGPHQPDAAAVLLSSLMNAVALLSFAGRGRRGAPRFPWAVSRDPAGSGPVGSRG